MSATAATCCHQAAASPPVYGALFTSRNGRAPRAASACRYASTFARYCGFVSIQVRTPAGGVQESSAAARPGNNDATPAQTTNKSSSFRTTAHYVAHETAANALLRAKSPISREEDLAGALRARAIALC